MRIIGSISISAAFLVAASGMGLSNALSNRELLSFLGFAAFLLFVGILLVGFGAIVAIIESGKKPPAPPSLSQLVQRQRRKHDWEDRKTAEEFFEKIK